MCYTPIRYRIMAIIGYTRVSTVEQSTERQDLGAVERTFTDKASGKNLERPQLQAMLDYIRAGDTVKVYSIDRLARSTKDLLELVAVITGKGCRLEFVSDNLQFGGQDDARNELMLTMLGAFATWERRTMLSRQAEGIAVIKAKDAQLPKEERTYRGRRATICVDAVKELVAKGLGASEIARQLGVSRQSVYRLM
jgi:DNA invertase Pin-like site-specific DNA recombinase